MKFLLTNDDGIDAPGIAALAEAVATLGELVVVAPHVHLSGCSHQATTDRPITVHQHGPGRFAVEGTPADCVRLALLHLAPDVDWVLSGINDGGNLGVDVWMSGTVAAAREATLFGKPAIAISQYRQRGTAFNTARSALWAAHIIPQLLERPTEQGVFWNVNLPDPLKDSAAQEVPEWIECPLDPEPLHVLYEQQANRYTFRGNYHLRPQTTGSDVAQCFAGAITATQVRLLS